jgi:hypothetical protein
LAPSRQVNFSGFDVDVVDVEVASMRVLTVIVLSMLVMSCTSSPAPAPAPAPAAPAAELKGSLNQVMRGILFPNSNIIFDAQSNDPAAAKAAEAKPGSGATATFAGVYGGWEAVENAAVALGEAANLVALPGRSCANGKPVPLNDPTFQKGLAALRQVSSEALKVAQAKNMDGMLDVADKVTMACSTCHDVYRDVQVDGKPASIEARCTPKG